MAGVNGSVVPDGTRNWSVRFPGNKLPGYYHLVPSGRAGRKVKLAPIGSRRGDKWQHATTFGKHHKDDKIPHLFDLAPKLGRIAPVLL